MTFFSEYKSYKDDSNDLALLDRTIDKIATSYNILSNKYKNKILLFNWTSFAKT